ncbi:AAA family ATPase [Tenggerimyces flavus]|uniref:AAA family ATPase n=1 Tax=Tenggerimyces flavus TaxID=1708749 RepID=A0ABV7YMQ8_9ACTN|nr:ATP-binding protein [Tenggerimyces flavus]MBM7788785.1 putative kinase [Tenggerimyces flavus]
MRDEDRTPPRVHLLCGLVAAGKTTYARRLEAELPAVRFTLDEWMLRLYGLSYDDPAYVARLEGCTSLIWDTAVQVLRLGHDVVLDWNQWSVDRRSSWRERAAASGCRVVLHHLDVSVETATERARGRDEEGGAGVHRVDDAGVRHSATIFEPPTAEEGIEILTISP